MTALRRLIKPKRLKSYLDLACGAFDGALAVAVRAGDTVLAASGAGGEELDPDAGTTVVFPLVTAEGETACLLVGPAPGAGLGRDEMERRAHFLGQSLQARIDAEEARRAITAEALENYRELSLLHRAAVDLNRTLQQADVADTLLLEIASSREGEAADAGMVFWRDPATGSFSPLRAVRSDGARDISAVADSELFRSIVAGIKGEIVNDLGAETRWSGEVDGVSALLIIPLTAHDHCSGAVVLGRFGAGAEFSAGDLKRAFTLASVAAATLHNARLFEEVVEIKNYNENVLQNLSNGVITVNPELRVTKTNAAALRILRREDDDLEGLALGDVFGGENDWVTQGVRAAMDAGGAGDWLDKELSLPGDDTVSINLVAVPLTNVEKRAVGYILVLEDITREKRIKGTMVRFMSDAVVEKLLAADDSLLGGTAQDVSILFSDVRSFTRLAERLSARETVATLNEYFSDMVDVIFERGGTLDKFIGDAIMAVFGAPFVGPMDTENAVATAVEMMERLRELNRRWAAADRARLDIGVGINTGSVVAGTIGSPKRMDYTVIGDHVNLAARIEAANKYYGTKILISEHTLERLDHRDRVREIDLVRVYGRERPVALHEILDYHTEESFPGLDKVLAAFEKGLADYRRREWRAAAGHFAAALEANPDDRPARIFLERCRGFQAHPPDDAWTPVTNMVQAGK